MPRSYLFVPGDAPDKLAKALGRGADALIVDLEDAVPPEGKEAARRAVVAWLRSGLEPGGAQLWVRVNSGHLRVPDVRELAGIPGADRAGAGQGGGRGRGGRPSPGCSPPRATTTPC